MENSVASSFSSMKPYSISLNIDESDDENDIQETDNVEYSDVQLQIERSRILNILNETMKNLGVVLCFNTLIDNNGRLLEDFFDTNEMDIILKGGAKYKNSTSQFIPSSSITFEHAVLWNEDPDLFYALQTLCDNSNCVKLARTLLCQDTESVEYAIFIAFLQLTQHLFDQINNKAEEERRRNNYLVSVWDKNEAAKQKIIDLKEKLEAQRQKFSNLITSKEQYMKKHEDNITKMNLECHQQIAGHTLIAERQMTNDWHETKTKQRHLKELSKKIQNDLEKLIENHLTMEKKTRAKRLKVETQLLSWIQKYDTEMGERQDRYDILLKKYEDEKYILKEMRTKFDEQEQIYTELMNEKHEYLHKLWCEKVHQFIINIAARHIQRWYRKILKTTAAKRRAALKAQKKGKN